MTRSAQRLYTVDEYAQLLDRFDTFLFDCDGVIWSGPKLIPGITDVLSLLRSRGKNILFVTNSASKSREMFKKAFDRFGIQASVDEIFGSAYASAIYISETLSFPPDKKVYVIGEEGIEQELKSVGIQYTGGTDPEDRVFAPPEDCPSTITPDPTIGAVLCGFDAYVNYKKYAKAHTYIMNNPGCEFILANADATYPDGGCCYPGSGSLSAPLRYSTKRTPTIIGKPHKHMMDTIMATHHFDPERTIMIGDNLETDILFGINSNIATLLVMTGVTNESHLSGEHKSDIIPDYIVESMGNFAVPAGEKQ